MEPLSASVLQVLIGIFATTTKIQIADKKDSQISELEDQIRILRRERKGKFREVDRGELELEISRLRGLMEGMGKENNDLRQQVGTLHARRMYS